MMEFNLEPAAEKRAHTIEYIESTLTEEMQIAFEQAMEYITNQLSYYKYSDTHMEMSVEYIPNCVRYSEVRNLCVEYLRSYGYTVIEDCSGSSRYIIICW